jgi:hypothetical protein
MLGVFSNQSISMAVANITGLPQHKAKYTTRKYVFDKEKHGSLMLKRVKVHQTNRLTLTREY